MKLTKFELELLTVDEMAAIKAGSCGCSSASTNSSGGDTDSGESDKD